MVEVAVSFLEGGHRLAVRVPARRSLGEAHEVLRRLVSHLGFAVVGNEGAVVGLEVPAPQRLERLGGRRVKESAVGREQPPVRHLPDSLVGELQPLASRVEDSPPDQLLDALGGRPASQARRALRASASHGDAPGRASVRAMPAKAWAFRVGTTSGSARRVRASKPPRSIKASWPPMVSAGGEHSNSPALLPPQTPVQTVR
jgi:hypothetical protein